MNVFAVIYLFPIVAVLFLVPPHLAQAEARMVDGGYKVSEPGSELTLKESDEEIFSMGEVIYHVRYGTQCVNYGSEGCPAKDFNITFQDANDHQIVVEANGIKTEIPLNNKKEAVLAMDGSHVHLLLKLTDYQKVVVKKIEGSAKQIEESYGEITTIFPGM